MHMCEIMVKDVAESKRINKSVGAEILKQKQSTKPAAQRRSAGTAVAAPELDVFDATIVSRQFWPSFQGDDIELHPLVKARAEEFARQYAVVKCQRKLVWKTNLGTVQLELSVGQGAERTSRNFSVSPTHATIIMYFGDRDTWTYVRHKISFRSLVLLCALQNIASLLRTSLSVGASRAPRGTVHA